VTIDSKGDRAFAAVDFAPFAAFLASANGTIVHANERLAGLFGYTVDQLVGQPMRILVPAEDRAQHERVRAGYMKAPTERPMGGGRDLFGVSKCGRRIPVDVSLHPVEGDEGTLVLCTVVDTTERSRREERYRLALDAAPNAILMVDGEGGIVLCNRHAETMFGHAPGSLIGRPVEVLLPDTLTAKHRTHRHDYMTAPTPRAMGSGRELTAVRANGEEFPVEVALQPVTTDDNQYVIAAVLDISARAHAWRRIETQHEELNREIRAMARSASHDLKGPLTTIVGLAGSMLEDIHAGDIAGVSQVAQWTRDLAARTAASLEKLRELADTVVADHDRSTFSLGDCLQETLAVLEPLRAAANITLHVEMASDLTPHSEQPRVAAILHNLLANAFQYYDPDTDDRWVRVRGHISGATLHLTIEDNGVGVSPSMRERVFELFERGDELERSGGGIGLALVRRHVRHLGGSIRLEPADVTTFVIALPSGTPA
jgi:PAS domain S-box-containing protein